MCLALEQPQTCTGATLGLLLRKTHFRDSRASLQKDYLLLLPSIKGHSGNSGVVPGNQGHNLRRVFESGFEKVLRRVLRRCLAAGFKGRKGSEMRSLKGTLWRGFREGTSKAETRPCDSTTPLRGHPALSSSAPQTGSETWRKTRRQADLSYSYTSILDF